MKRYRLTGNYGTFEITKVVEADHENDAFVHSGIMSDLIDAGWEFTQRPEGEEWTIEEVVYWKPTHVSVRDGSSIRVVDSFIQIHGAVGTATPGHREVMFTCENENGDRWTDRADRWEEVT